ARACSSPPPATPPPATPPPRPTSARSPTRRTSPTSPRCSVRRRRRGSASGAWSPDAVMGRGPAEVAALERAKAVLDRFDFYPEKVRIDRVRILHVPWLFRLPWFRRFHG